MSIKEKIKNATVKSQQFASAADSIRTLNPVLRSPRDRSEKTDEEQLELIPNNTNFDIKINTSILASGLDKSVSDVVHLVIKDALKNASKKLSHCAFDILKNADSSMEKENVNSDIGD